MKRTLQQRFPRGSALAWPGALLLAAGLGFGSCSKGGGGGDGLAPVLLSVSFGGTGPNPVAGDIVLLFFSEDVRDVTGTPVTDEDLVLCGDFQQEHGFQN